MRRGLEVLPSEELLCQFVSYFMGFLCFCHPAQRVWLIHWRPASGMKVMVKKQRRRDLRRAAALQDRAEDQRTGVIGPSPEPR